MKTADLKRFLDNQYAQYHRREYLSLDPLICLDGFAFSGDLEIAGLAASVLAYGRAETIIRNVRGLFAITGRSPAEFATGTTFADKKRLFRNFRHRFNDGVDLAALLHGAGMLRREYGSLEALFTAGSLLHHGSIKGALEYFTDELKRRAIRLAPEHAKSIAFLLPSPASGSACKRLNMYLRWMVRERDGIDLGIWKEISPSGLIMPVDTHVARIARELGLSRRRSVDWLMAEQITAHLRTCDPADPVRYDFSLCRSGMVDFRKRAA